MECLFGARHWFFVNRSLRRTLVQMEFYSAKNSPNKLQSALSTNSFEF